MATTVTLDPAIVQQVQRETSERSKAAAVRTALNEYLRLRRLRRLADMAGTIDLGYTNDDLEAIEDC